MPITPMTKPGRGLIGRVCCRALLSFENDYIVGRDGVRLPSNPSFRRHGFYGAGRRFDFRDHVGNASVRKFA